MVESEGSFNTTFEIPGFHLLNFEINQSNGTVIRFRQMIRIKNFRTAGVNCESPETEITADIAFQGYEESSPRKGKGKFKIYYKYSGDCRLTKPVIVLDGFDPDGKRDFKELYDVKLVYNGNQKLGDELRSDGYDVIILDEPLYKIGVHYKTIVTVIPPHGPYGGNGQIIKQSVPVDDYIVGGSDYIERNAFVLIKLIENVKDSLVKNNSSEQLVVVGPSMGGQISRYGLKYMENHGMNHQTRYG